MIEIPDRQPNFIVDGVVTNRPLVTIKRHADIADVDITSAQCQEDADGSVFALVTWEEWPSDGSGWRSTT